MNEDREVTAIARINDILSGLTSDESGRVLRWAVDRYGIELPEGLDGEGETELAARAAGEFDSVGRFFEAIGPQTEQERTLAVAYWQQVVRGSQGLDALQINASLKHLGCGAKNITRALDGLIHRQPALMIQTRKGGSTRQARKTYRLTADGIQHVNWLLRTSGLHRVGRGDSLGFGGWQPGGHGSGTESGEPRPARDAVVSSSESR